MPAAFVCGRCGAFACGDCAFWPGIALCRACSARGLPEPIPWERRKELGKWTAFWQTTKLVLTSPTAFFRTPTVEHGLGGSLLYGCLAYVSGYLTLMLMVALLYMVGGVVAGVVTEEAGIAGLLIGEGVCLAVMGLVQVPVYALLGILLGGGLTHVTLVMLKTPKAKFEQTVRAVAYANAACIWYAIPCFGIIGWPWMLVNEVLGVRETHRISAGRATMAVLGYRIVFMVGIVLLYAALIAFAFTIGAPRGGGY